MRKSFHYIFVLFIVVFSGACQSDADKANEIFSSAIAMEKAKNNVPQPALDSGRLAIQYSIYTNPVKQVPGQEELIKKYKVKSVKQLYTDGWLIETYDKKGNKISEESDYSGKKTIAYRFDKTGKVKEQRIKYKDGY